MDGYLIPDTETDEIFPHLTGNMRQDFVTIVQLDAEHGIWEDMCDASLSFYTVRFRHI